MKKLLFALLFISISAFSQQAKKEYLFNASGKIVTETEFKRLISPPTYTYTPSITENDTAIIARAVLRKQSGILSADKLAAVYDELKKITGQDTDKSKIIVINYYYKEPVRKQRPMIDHYTSDKAYLKFVKKNTTISQFFITEKNYNYSKDYVLEDKNGSIGKLLFEYPFSANYIIIKPDGSYYRQVSEYRQDEIPEIIKKGW